LLVLRSIEASLQNDKIIEKKVLDKFFDIFVIIFSDFIEKF